MFRTRAVMNGGAARLARVTVSILLGGVVLVSGCAESSSKGVAEGAFTVAVTAEAKRVSEKAGVNLERLVAESAAKVLSLLPHRGRIRIQVRLDAGVSIPEVGVGGYADPQSGNVLLSIDATPPGGLRRALETWIPQAVAHELHHSSRIRTGPGYGKTLGEALVTEGLAEHFVDEVFPAVPPRPWDNVLSKAQERVLWQQAEPVLWLTYDHITWFFGGGYKTPRWAGYTLGYRIVEAYLGEAGSAGAAVGVAAKKVVAPYARLARLPRGS